MALTLAMTHDSAHFYRLWRPHVAATSENGKARAKTDARTTDGRLNLIRDSTVMRQVAKAVPEGSEADYGVYAQLRPRSVLHSEVIEIKPAALPRRKPQITSDDGFMAVFDDE